MTKYIHPLHQQAINHAPTVKSKAKQLNISFSDVLAKHTTLSISKHAKERMMERNININEQQWQLINQKVFEAKQKGVTDALVVVDDATLVVSAKNSTVITVVDREEMKSQIFTNIDGTISLVMKNIGKITNLN